MKNILIGLVTIFLLPTIVFAEVETITATHKYVMGAHYLESQSRCVEHLLGSSEYHEQRYLYKQPEYKLMRKAKKQCINLKKAWDQPGWTDRLIEKVDTH